MITRRRSGIVLHPTSLPGPHGIGDFGKEAERFVDTLVKMKQGVWQILPLGPTGFGNSPYMSLSAFAGNPLLISLEKLCAEGLLSSEDLGEPQFSGNAVNYEQVRRYKTPLLRKAAHSFFKNPRKQAQKDLENFCEENRDWLEDFALFCSLKSARGERLWTAWEKELVRREPQALRKVADQYSDEIRFHQFLQFFFFKQWAELKRYTNTKGIEIIGDVPIYVAHDSADVWANPELYYLDESGNPTVVAGVPPDYYSATGQRWGNPIYRWGLMEKNGFRWWIKRFKRLMSQADLVRIDHFRGLEAYWEIPAKEPTAVVGRWVKGPGDKFFEAIRKELGQIPVIAEDLGVITPEVEALRERFGLPGMRVLQVAFSTDAKADDYLPHHYVENCVAYSATHDHNTTVGWFTADAGSQTTQTPEEIEKERRQVKAYLDSDGSQIHWDMIRAALKSKANLCIFPLQDVMGLGSEARMNRPGRADGNWQWRFSKEMLSQEMIEKMARFVEDSNRMP